MVNLNGAFHHKTKCHKVSPFLRKKGFHKVTPFSKEIIGFTKDKKKNSIYNKYVVFLWFLGVFLTNLNTLRRNNPTFLGDISGIFTFHILILYFKGIFQNADYIHTNMQCKWDSALAHINIFIQNIVWLLLLPSEVSFTRTRVVFFEHEY